MKDPQDAAPFDIIGRVVKIGDPRKKHTRDGKEKRLLEIVLQDYEGIVLNCTIWEEYVDAFLLEFNEHDIARNILIIQFCRATSYQGKVQIQNAFRVSKLLLNAKIPQVQDFLERIVNITLSERSISSFPPGSISSEGQEISSDTLSLSTIKETCSSQGGSFYLSAIVVNIDDSAGWFYYSCSTCRKKLKDMNRAFYCEKCKSWPDSPEMKYKLIIFVADDTSSCSLLIWDTEAKDLFGKSASELYQEMTEEEEFPSYIFQHLMNKKFIFGVKVGDGETWRFERPLVVNYLKNVLIPVDEKSHIEDESGTSNNPSMFSESHQPSQDTPSYPPMKTSVEPNDEINKNLMDAFSSSKCSANPTEEVKTEKRD